MLRLKSNQICFDTFSNNINHIIYISIQYFQVLIGFADGVLRLYYIESAITPGSSLMKLMKSLSVKMKLLQAIKPHRTAIIAMDLDKKHKILATASKDKSVYVYRAKSKEGIFQMIPIGYFQMKENIVNIVFKKERKNICLMIALVNNQLLLLNLNNLSQTTTENLAMSIQEFPNNTLDLAEQLSISNDQKLINASFKDGCSNVIQLIYSNNNKTVMAEVTTSDQDLSDIDSAHVNQLPDPPGHSQISILRYWSSGNFLLIGYENGTFRMVDIR